MVTLMQESVEFFLGCCVAGPYDASAGLPRGDGTDAGGGRRPTREGAARAGVSVPAEHRGVAGLRPQGRRPSEGICLICSKRATCSRVSRHLDPVLVLVAGCYGVGAL